MEHQNLFLYENNAAMNVDYPDRKVNSPIPGVAYARADADSASTVIYNKKKVTYTVTVSHQDRSGNTVTANTSLETPITLEGRPVKVNVVAEDVAGYKPILPVEKIEVSQDTAHTCLYLTAVTYVVTVHHMSEGEAISGDTTVNVPAFEGETVGVELTPLVIEGYTSPEAVNVEVSGNMEYTFEYEKVINLCYVDLGLPSGTLWACYNLGAEHTYEIGNLYEWGDIDPYDTGVTWDRWNGYKFSINGTSAMSKYNTADGLTTLLPEDDAATVELGSNWHTPTMEQWYELLDNTVKEEEYDDEHSINYEVFVSKNNGEKLYFPEFVFRGFQNTESFITWLNQTEKYSAVSGDECDAYVVGSLCEGVENMYGFYRCCYSPIRPVSGNVQSSPAPGSDPTR